MFEDVRCSAIFQIVNNLLRVKNKNNKMKWYTMRTAKCIHICVRCIS